MSRRIEIELTSSRPDGTWTWRAAGAREPKGVLDGSILPSGSKSGDVVKVDAEFDIDGIEILSVVQARAKVNKVETLTIIGSDKPFEPVTQQLAKRSDKRGPRRERRDGDRREDRRDGDRRGERREGRAEGNERRPRPEGDRPRGPRRPRFEAPPELPQRPRPKRLKPGSQHRKAVLADLPENQRPIAELALQGMQAVRQRLKSANEALAADGKPTMPEQSVLQMAQDLIPRLRVADWLDRAEAAKRDLDNLDLRDLRSVLAAANDPWIERDENCRNLLGELKAGLTARTAAEHQNWLSDIGAAVDVGRVVRALKLAGQPPKPGERLPDDLARRLTDVTIANLTADALPERWIAVLEAAAFAPIRGQIKVAAAPTQSSPELQKTVERLAALLPQIATLFGVAAPSGGQLPKPLRPTRPANKKIPPKPSATPTAEPSPAAPAAPEAVVESAPAEPVVAAEVPNETITEAPTGESTAD